MIDFGQGFLSMNYPTNELLGLVLSKKIRHGGNEILTWNAGNAAAVYDAARNIKLVKAKVNEAEAPFPVY
jgi:phage terminase large subunit-like protein